MRPQPLIQWRFLDGRAGHESQVLGLSEAIASACASVMVDVPVDESLRGWRAWLPGRFDFLRSASAPQLLIGAGHATHAALLRCQRLFGGRTVVLMKPSLPAGLFDLCLVPGHDRLLWPWSNVERTAGALNRMQRSEHRGDDQGLVLLGGPSRHFRWSNAQVRRSVSDLMAAHSLRWTVVASRRTPTDFWDGWDDPPAGVAWRMANELSAAELAMLVGVAARVAVTSDSISMISEALTSGAPVDLIDLPPRRASRMATEVRLLVRNSELIAGNLSQRPEAERCAAVVLERLICREGRPANTGQIGVSRVQAAGMCPASVQPGGIMAGAVSVFGATRLSPVMLQDRDR